MLSIEKRPNSFDEVVGQDIVVKLLKAIVKKPESSPRSLMLCGPFGCGKTTLARIFAKELNKGFYDGDIENSPFYFEFDSSVVGNVQTIRDLRDYFTWSGDGYRVFLFDEIQLARNEAQSALLKVIEEVSDKCFFIFCTTNPEKILPTILSRSLLLQLSLISEEDLMIRLNEVVGQLGVEVSSEIKEMIVQRSNGHGRNLMMLLDNCLLLGEEEFKDYVKSSISLFRNLFAYMLKKDYNNFKTVLDNLLEFSLIDLKADYEKFLLLLIRGCIDEGSADARVKAIVPTVRPVLWRFINSCRQDVVLGGFNSTVSFMSSMNLLYSMFGGAR